jgi:hypothetical protein
VAEEFQYPTGIYGSQNLGLEPVEEKNPGDDPSWVAGPVLDMSTQWTPIDVCVGGTQVLRLNAKTILPQEPREDEDAWKRRIYHATLVPYLTRIAEQAAGLILRKPIQLVAEEEGAEVDPYWEQFVNNVDGYGTNLDAFARRIVISSLLYGHAGILVDYPSTEAAANLQEERLRGLRPYFIKVDAKQILGWRRAEGSPIAPITQVRINEYVHEPVGEFGDELVQQIRVLEPGRWRLFRTGGAEGQQNWTVIAEGSTSLPIIPLSITYSSKVAEFISTPPLLEVANLNIAHAQRTADLHHSLHIAAMPILTLKAFDDNESTVGLSANNAIMLPPDGDASYVEPASSAFDAQQNFIHEIENQMSTLGISVLFQQKMGSETAESKRLSRTDSDSLLAIVSKDLQDALQQAFNAAGAFVNIQAPEVHLNRDFDIQVLDGTQVGQYMQLWMNGAITHETLLEMLRDGEVLPNVDVEAEVELTGQEKAQNMMVNMLPDVAAANGAAGAAAASDEQQSEQPSEIRSLVEERLRRMAGASTTDDDDDET